MDDLTAFVSTFCSELARRDAEMRRMFAWYAFDKRPGSAEENFKRDAADYNDYLRMFTP